MRSQIYWARRLLQTPRAFRNWPQVYRDLARGRFGRGPETLTFRTRTGVRIDTPNRPGARVPVYEIFAEDTYRLDWFLGPLRDRAIEVIDIGGHVGTFSVALTRLHDQALITSFEPSRTSAAYLRRNLAQNGVADRVRVVECALGAVSGSAEFVDNSGGSGLNRLASIGGSTGTLTHVDTVCFDEAVAMVRAPVDVVKIDCEGGEYALVLSSAPSSWRSVQRVVIEYHPVEGHTWAELRDYYASVGLTEQARVSWQGYGCVWLSRTPLSAPR